MNEFLPILRTDSLILRELRRSDAEAIYDYRKDKSQFQFVSMPVYLSIDEAYAYIEKMNRGVLNKEWYTWGIERKEDHRLIGTISLWNMDEKQEKAELGYGIFKNFRRQGYMSEAIAVVTKFAFDELRLKSVEAYTSTANEPSNAMLLKAGFEYRETIEERGPLSDEVLHMNIYRREDN